MANSLERGGPLSSLSCPGFSDPLEKAHRAFTHSRGRLVPTCSSTSPRNRTLLGFRVNQGISASFSLLLSYRQLQTTRFQSIKGPAGHVRLFTTPWTVVLQAPHPWDFLGKNTAVGCHFFLQRIFPIPRIKPTPPRLLHYRWILYHWATWEAPVSP